MQSRFLPSFSPKLVLGLSVAVIATLFTGVSIHTVQSMNRLARLTEQLYDHPFTVNTAVLRIEAGIVSMHRSMKDVALANSPEEIIAASQKVDQIEQAVFDDFEIVLAQFLGDKAVIEAARQEFADWKPIRDRVIQLRQDGEIAQAAAITKGEGADYIQALLTDIDQVEAFARNKAAQFLAEAQATQRHILRLTTGLLAMVILVTGTWVTWMLRLLQQRAQSAAHLALQARRAEVLLQLPKVAEAVDEDTFLQQGQEIAEDLTNSQIAFIHFIKDGGETIELVTWSRRTLEHHCNAAFESHYPVKQAGIWADALRRKQAVVFNDYDRYPHKHGLPEGHAHLERLISVPVMEDGEVVMITGVGNKATPYTELDLETVQLISNEIWRMVQRRRTLARLEASEYKLQQAQQIAQLASWEMDHHTRNIVWSDGILKIVETLPAQLGNSYDALRARVHPDDVATVNRTFANAVENHQTYEMIYRLLMGDGAIKHVHERGETAYTDAGEPLRTLGTLQDVTQQMRAEAKLRQAAAVFKNTAEGVLLTDLKGTILEVNQAFSTITGYSREDILGKNPRVLQSGRYSKDFYAALWKSLIQQGNWQGEIWNRRKDGSTYPELLTISTVTDEKGKPSGYVAVFSDITKVKESEAKLYHLAHHHPLTDLPNRLLLDVRLSQSLHHVRRNQTKLAVIFIYIDRFKNINDSMGHPIGDQVLQEFAHRLQPLFRSSDTLAHLGGDEFVLVLEDITNAHSILPMVDKVQGVLKQPFKLVDLEIYITASLGISLFPDDGNAGDILLRNADAAMYKAKSSGGNTYCFYTEEMTAAALKYVEFDHALREAIVQGQFHLVYQPQIDFVTQQWVGMEALLRWHHPILGQVSPGVFIPISEQTGLIREIGAWVLRQACVQGRQWLNDGLAVGRISVNVAGPQIQSGDLVAVLTQTLAETQFPPQALELEVTEGFIMQRPESQIQQLRTIQEMGVKIAIDDFGTGYSSLSYLKQLPIDKLKIDQSFVRDIPRDPDDMAIAEAVIALGQALNLETIAEGVETEAQATFLRDKGCEQAQGYLYSKPVEPAMIPRLLNPS
jgi:diguanylate cyclase (GGDEF)-like protein/PAS domain S-box-containing protein